MPFDLFNCGASYTLTRQDGFTVSLPQALRTRRYVLLFLASQWWAPCRGVTAQLSSFYTQLRDTHNFEVIFLSTDKSEKAMLDFFHDAHGDWLCLSYNDARHLEAELAGESDLHPKQIPACLVFEIDSGALQGRSKEEEEEGRKKTQDSASVSPLASLAPPTQSFARLITKHGREMLSRDKEGALFPWHDDGWSDAAAVQRSATLRQTPEERTPAAATPSTVSPADAAVVAAASTPISTPVSTPAAPAASTAAPTAEPEPSPSSTAAKHVEVVMHTNPRAARPAATPRTQLILKHQPATAAAVAEEAEVEDETQGTAAEAKETVTEEAVHAAEGDDTTQGEATTEAANAAPELDMSPDARCSGEPDSRRQLSFSQSPELCAVRRTPKARPPSRVIVVERRVAASMHAVERTEDGSAEGVADEEAGVLLHEVLEARVSAVLERATDSDTSTDSEDDADELSVVEKQLSEDPLEV